MPSARILALSLLALAAACSDSPERADTTAPPDTVEPDATAPDVVGDTLDTADDTSPDVPTTTGRCGDGVRGVGEDCDGEDLGTTACTDLGFSGGQLACNAACLYELGRCEGSWTCAPDEAEDDDDHLTAKAPAPGRHRRTFCAGDEDWVIIDTPASGHDAVTLFIYDTGREVQLAPEIWGAPEGGNPRFYMNVIDQAPLPGTERTTRYWAWSELLHDPRFGPRPARLYLRVRAIGADASFLYAVSHQTGLGCTEHGDCAPDTRCERSTFACVPGCEIAERGNSLCSEGKVCTGGQCVAAECSRNDDCGLGRACQMRICVDAVCASDMECPAFGLRTCDEQAGRCVDCVAPSDCPFPESATCVDHRCGTDCTDDAFAPNQARDAAAVLDIDTTFSAPELMLCGVYAEDWFRFTLDEPSPLRINVSFSPDEGDIDVGLYRAGESEPLAVAESYGAPERITLETAAAGTYELWVFFWPRPENLEPVTRALQSYGLSISAAPIECRAHRECAVDRVCVDFLCVTTTCELDAACGAYGMPCDEGAGFCAECGADEDCGPLEACLDHRCAPTCTDDPYEANDTRADAAALAEGRHDLVLCKARGEVEEDWFRFDLAAEELLALRLDNLLGLETYEGLTQFATLELYREDGQLLPLSSDGLMPLFWRPDAAETLYARVSVIPLGAPSDRARLGGPLAYSLLVGREPECIATDPSGASDACGEGEVCVDLRCVEGCLVHSDCPGTDLCFGGACVTPQCTTQADCGPDESCAWQFCMPAQGCDEDFDCTFAQRSDFTNARFCDLDAGRCVECLDVGQCASPSTCVEHACVLSCDDDDLEPNDTLETAAPLGFGVYPDLMLCDVPADPSDPRQRSDDWYEVEVEAGDTVVGRVEWQAGEYNLDFEMIDAAGASGIITAAGQDMLQITLHATATGSAYLRVLRAEAWATTPYSLSLFRVACEEHAECGLGEACVDFQCVATSCTEDHECWSYSSTYECDKPAGYCRECQTDDECSPDYLTCREGHCALDCTPDAYEPVIEQGIPASIALPFSGDDLTLCGQFDRDFFGFQLAANRTYTMRATPSTHGPEAVLLSLHRLDPLGPLGLAFVKSSTASGAAQVLTFTTGAQAQPYVLEVQWMVLDGALTYDLTIQ